MLVPGKSKGYSNHCSLSTTVARAIYMAATAAAAMFIKKSSRCPSTGAKVTDHLSKGEFAASRTKATLDGEALAPEPARLPAQLLHRRQVPCDDVNLGGRIVAEISANMQVLRGFL
jgi:hypothetical protein